MENGKPVQGSIYFYAPNKGGPVFFATLFAVSGAIHAYQCIRYKCWKVSGILPWAAVVFTVGYVLREIGAFNYDNLPIYISQLVFIYCAPPLYELSNYFVLSRCLYYIPYHSPIHPGRVLTTFAAISTVIEVLNAQAARIVANTKNTPQELNTGHKLLKAALVMQLTVLALFVALTLTFHRNCKKAKLLPKNLAAVLTTLYISSLLIGVRTLYRTVEYFVIADINFRDPNLNIDDISVAVRYEWFFYVFEAVLMGINSVLLNARHPMRFLPRDNKIYLAEDGVTEVQGEGYEDKRSFIVTLLDPFDLNGMRKGRNMRQKFWETHNEGRAADPGNNAEAVEVNDDAKRNLATV